MLRTSVMNAIGPFAIRISQDDIDCGIPGDPENCAAVQALKHHPDVIGAEVYRTRALIKFKMYLGVHPDQIVRYKTPASLRLETAIIDRGGKMYVGDHTFLPLRDTELPTGRRQGSKTNENGKPDAEGVISQTIEAKIGTPRRKLIPGLRPGMKKG
jgi:hypothetical protein